MCTCFVFHIIYGSPQPESSPLFFNHPLPPVGCIRGTASVLPSPCCSFSSSGIDWFSFCFNTYNNISCVIYISISASTSSSTSTSSSASTSSSVSTPTTTRYKWYFWHNVFGFLNESIFSQLNLTLGRIYFIKMILSSLELIVEKHIYCNFVCWSR